MKEIMKNELKGWKYWEIAWLLIACVIITGLAIYWKDTPMGIISATTGVACVVCTGKGKLSAYGFGLVNSILYAIIAYQAKLYGETMLNAIYYVPMQFYGFYVWSRHMNNTTNEVTKKRMSLQQRLCLIGTIIASTYLYGIFLKHIGDAMPFVDSFTTVSSVIAMLISVKMFAEQWYIWVAVNIFSVYMWWCTGGNMATLLMWIVYLINSILMLVKWEKEARQ